MSEVAKWYVLKVKPNYEARVQLGLEKIIKDGDLSKEILQISIPKKDTVRVKKGKKVSAQEKICKGYVFIEVKPSEKFTMADLIHSVKKVDGVINFVGGTRSVPSEVPAEQLAVIQQVAQESVDNPQTQVSFTEGETVAVISGPFKNFNGIVKEVNADKCRVKLSVSIFGRPTALELDFSEVHKER